MPTIQVGVQEAPGSLGQIVDIDSPVANVTSLVNTSPLSIDYSVDYGNNWVTVAAGGSAAPGLITGSELRVRRSTAGGYPQTITVTYSDASQPVLYNSDNASLNASGNPISVGGSKATSYLGPVATRTLLADQKHGTNKQGNCRTLHFARDYITDIAVEYANWYYAFTVETATGGTMQIAASIEYPLGSTPQQFLWSGASVGSIPDLASLVSDTLTLATPIPQGAQFALIVWQNSPGGLIYTTNAAYLTNERSEFGVTVANRTATGGTSFGSQSTGFGIYPVSILGMTTRPTVALLGDSRQRGSVNLVTTSFAGTGYGDQGMAARGVGPLYAYCNLGSHGDRINAFVLSNGARRRAIAARCSHWLIQYGTNDLAVPRTAVQILADMATLATQGAGKVIGVQTVGPVTTSTDSFATLVNQTVTANEAERLALNAALRAGQSWAQYVVDTAADNEVLGGSGGTSLVWPVGRTIDGTHENQTGQIASSAKAAAFAGTFNR